MLAVRSLEQSSSAPLHCFLLCEPSVVGRALLAGLDAAAASVTYAATREDFAAALMIRDARRQVDRRAFAKAEEELDSKRVTFALHPKVQRDQNVKTYLQILAKTRSTGRTLGCRGCNFVEAGAKKLRPDTVVNWILMRH